MSIDTIANNIAIEGIPQEVIAELEDASAIVQRTDVPLQYINTDGLDLGNTTETMATMLQLLNDPECGVVILGRIPVEHYAREQVRIMYTLMGQSLAPMVDQKVGGTKSYSVKDYGNKRGVRASTTNLPQAPHSDGAFVAVPPPYMGLGCIQQSLTGGDSLLWDFRFVYNHFLHEFPETLERLRQPFCWDRQDEHLDNELPYSEHPVFWYEGEVLQCRWYADYIRKGYQKAGRVLSQEDETTIQTVEVELSLQDDEFFHQFRLEPGSVLYINNRWYLHARTGFEPQSQREMLRTWHRSTGTTSLEGM